MEGWIKIWRSFLKWEWWDDHNTTRLFIYLLLAANYENKKWHGFPVDRGQLITSFANLHKTTGLSVRSIRTCINRLKTTNELTIKTTKKYTIITLCNYDYYQDK
jgi:hypothetical protein